MWGLRARAIPHTNILDMAGPLNARRCCIAFGSALLRRNVSLQVLQSRIVAMARLVQRASMLFFKSSAVPFNGVRRGALSRELPPSFLKGPSMTMT